MGNRRNVIVTATGGRSVGSGIVHSLLRASENVAQRWNVIATDADPFAWGLYVAPHRALLPLANHPSYKDELISLARKFNVSAIIPGSEAETTIISKYQDELGEFNPICNRFELMTFMNDKFKLETELDRLGFKYIPTYPLKRAEEMISEFGYPLVSKPTTGTGGSKGVFLLPDANSLSKLRESVENDDKVCVQPYLGDAEHEFTIGILSSKEGQIIDSIIMKRKLIGLSLLSNQNVNGTEVAISTGYSQGFIIDYPKLRLFCENVAQTFGSSGPLNLQVREHKGEFYIFDFHPRFSGTTPIRSDVGFNEVDLLLRNHLDDEQIGRQNYSKNVAAIRAFEHVIVPIDQMLNKPL